MREGYKNLNQDSRYYRRRSDTRSFTEASVGTLLRAQVEYKQQSCFLNALQFTGNDDLFKSFPARAQSCL